MFETIIVKQGIIQYFNYHFSRLSKGMKVLRLADKIPFTQNGLASQIELLLEENELLEDARVKIQVWRKDGGLYTPQSMDFDLLISVQQHEMQSELKCIKLGVSTSVKIQYNPFSEFKTLSSLPYVMAGIEKKERGLDDVLLMSTGGFVAECLASNIFWERNGIYYTPSLKSGCIAGIRREVITRFLRKQGYIVRRKMARKRDLWEADFAFNANVASIHIISQIEDKKYAKDEGKEQLISELIS